MTWDNWQPYTEPKGWEATRQRIFARDKSICHVCGLAGATQVDHIIPVSAGGTHNDDNLAPIHHRPCHTRKTRQQQQRKPAPTERRTPETHPGYI